MWWRKKQKEAIKNNSNSVTTVSPTVSTTRFLDPEVLSRIGSLELLARVVVEGFISGLHRSSYTGFSTEFAEYRQYQPGDDLRYLDWRLYGRTDRFFIKKYRADTNTQFHILIDTSASMNYSTGTVSKFEYARFLSAALTYLVSRQQDAIGLVAFNKQVYSHVPARNRTGHINTIYGHLLQLTTGDETDLSKMLHETADRIARRGVLILISDMYEDPAKLSSALQHLRFRGHDVVIFHVLDKNELEFSFNEPVVLLEDSETLEQMPVQAEAITKEYRKRMELHIKDMRETAAANHVDYELITTDKPLDFALFSFLSRRNRK
jgi:uncharacterized protein (DUF58 family)